MRRIGWLLLGIGCGAPGVDGAPDKLPGSPFVGETTSFATDDGSGFVPAAFGLGATWGVDGGAPGPWRAADGSTRDAEVTLFLFTRSYLEEGDAAGLCTVTWPVTTADRWVETFDYATFSTGSTGPWTARGFVATLDAASATTTCVGLDRARWGDPGDLLDGATIAVGATVANDDILASLVPSQADLSRFTGAAVQWDLFDRYEELTSDTYQLGAAAYYADGAVEPGAEDPFTASTLPDGAYVAQPTLVLVAEALRLRLD